MDAVINGEISEEFSAKKKETNDDPSSVEESEDSLVSNIADVHLTKENEATDNLCPENSNTTLSVVNDNSHFESHSINLSEQVNDVCTSPGDEVIKPLEMKENGLDSSSPNEVPKPVISFDVTNVDSSPVVEDDTEQESTSEVVNVPSEQAENAKEEALSAVLSESNKSQCDEDVELCTVDKKGKDCEHPTKTENKQTDLIDKIKSLDKDRKQCPSDAASIQTARKNAMKDICSYKEPILNSNECHKTSSVDIGCGIKKGEDHVIKICEGSAEQVANEPLNFSNILPSMISSDVSRTESVGASNKVCSERGFDPHYSISALKKLESSIINPCQSENTNLDLAGYKFPHTGFKAMDCIESSFIEQNPLAKLNEHLNSIGFDKVHSHSFSNTHKNDTSLTKEASIIPQKHEPFKNCHKGHKNSENIGGSLERVNNESSDSFVFTELSKEETGFPEVFTGLVTIGKYISVKGDFTLRSTEALVESPSLTAPYLLKEPDTFPPRDQESKTEPKDFFHTSAGEILIGIGLSRVNEWFHKDMARIKKRQIKREGKLPQLEEELNMHETCYGEAKKANSVYSFSYKTCKTCNFSTESSVVMEGHLLVPHITSRREYQCNFCDVVNRDPKGMLDHMESAHGKTGRIQPPVLFFECPFCTFESNSKVKLNTHLTKCQKFFDPAINQAPPRDFEFPALTPKPITVAVVKAYEKSLSSMQRGRGRPKKVDNITDSIHMNQFPQNVNHPPVVPNHLPPYRPNSNSPLSESVSIQNQIIPPIQMPNMNLRPAHSNAMGQLRSPMPPMHMPPPNRFFQVVNSTGQLMPMLGNSHLVTSPSQFPFSSTLVNSGSKKVHAPTAPFFNSLFGSGLRQQNPPKSISDLTITPLPKLQGPYPVPLVKSSAPSGNTSMQSGSLVVCEICDGYIKDLEQLRTHMQLIHKVKIHPKMLVSRPPLNCQKCQWRFFTDQGLERHLLGAHGLVTSNMQELANKSKDAGCCTICGRVYASKLVSHMNQVHKVTLKPAHLSYKCTVCSATFNLYRLFENHVYLVHSGAAKRPAEGNSNPSKKLKTPNFEKGDVLSAGEPKNLKEKRISNDGECKDCGSDISNDRKYSAQSEKCEKCLKSDELIPGTISSKTYREELRKNEKSCEKTSF